MKKLLAVVAVAGLAGLAHGQIWNESGDAGDLGGGQGTGAGALSQIIGNLAANDVDMYTIRVDDWSLFLASATDVSGLGSPESDTQMFLFAANGTGIAMNDDAVGGGLRSEFENGNAIYSGRTNGEIVWIAISGYNQDPTSGGQTIWANSPFNVTRAPDGVNPAGAVDGWTGTNTTGGDYRITLRGVSAVPAPGALALLGLGGLVVGRRRR